MKFSSSFQEAFREEEFRESVDQALERVRVILQTTRHPYVAHEDDDHQYDDKFALAEGLIRTGIAAQINALECLGLDHQKTKQILIWIHQNNQAVRLRFQAEDMCSFVKEETVEIRNLEKRTVKSTRNRSRRKTLTEVVVKMREYHWKISVNYRIIAFTGPSPEKGNSLILLKRSASTILVISGGQVTPTSNNNSSSRLNVPFPAHTINPSVDVDVSWLFRNLKQHDHQSQFSIDRDSVESSRRSKTPRRNNDVDDAIRFMKQFSHWARRMENFFVYRVNILTRQHHIPARSPQDNSVLGFRAVAEELLFVPVVPLMEKGSVLAIGDVECLLNEQKRSLGEGIAMIGETHSPTEAEKLVTASEAVIVLVSLHMAQIARHCEMGVDYIEEMLRKQVIKAIGKELKVKDFETFLKYHNQKLFAPGYAPRPFCYAIRRPEHYPDGVFTIEATEGDNEPIQTWVRHVPASSGISTMTIPIGAATVVELKCERYVHGWMKPIFHDQHDSFQAVARARQFSSFLLVVGTMSGPNRLDPKQAIILQNKDEIIIPLLIETLPSSKDFKDAISSLSPEQQEFAKTFRAMQLGSSVFGVCIIQLKPQLERLLRLPDGALTKEIKLTQDLMSLFVDYQIPSDLLSYNGVEDAPALEKVMSVKGYVQSVLDVVKGEKLQQLEDEKLKSEMRRVSDADSSDSSDSCTSESFLEGLRCNTNTTRSDSLENLKQKKNRPGLFSKLSWSNRRHTAEMPEPRNVSPLRPGPGVGGAKKPNGIPTIIEPKPTMPLERHTTCTSEITMDSMLHTTFPNGGRVPMRRNGSMGGNDTNQPQLGNRTPEVENPYEVHSDLHTIPIAADILSFPISRASLGAAGSGTRQNANMVRNVTSCVTYYAHSPPLTASPTSRKVEENDDDFAKLEELPDTSQTKPYRMSVISDTSSQSGIDVAAFAKMGSKYFEKSHGNSTFTDDSEGMQEAFERSVTEMSIVDSQVSPPGDHDSAEEQMKKAIELSLQESTITDEALTEFDEAALEEADACDEGESGEESGSAEEEENDDDAEGGQLATSHDMDSTISKNTSASHADHATFSLDVTAIPSALDKLFEQFDKDNSLRSSVIKPRHPWKRIQQLNLLTGSSCDTMADDEIEIQRKKAFDLLDAISRSGALPIDAAELHVVVAVSHCFENDIMGSIIQDNINPIAKVEKSSLMIASTIHGISPAGLLAQDVDRFTMAFANEQ